MFVSAWTMKVVVADADRRDVGVCMVVVQGFFKVLGKGKLPNVPLVVRAKYFSKDVSSATVV